MPIVTSPPTVTSHSGPAPTGVLSTEELATLVDDLARRPAGWLGAVRFSPTERWWTTLHSDETVDVWLITWIRDTGTELHDHGDSRGAFTVVSGVLEEVRPIGPHGLMVSTSLGAGDVRRIERGAIHDVRCPTHAPSISIHAYSPPLREMTYYRPLDSGPVPVRTVTTSDGSPG